MNEPTIYRLEQMIQGIERLNGKCEDNMKRLNQMMLELKGIVARVRPMAAKNAWYGEELQSKAECIDEGKNPKLIKIPDPPQIVLDIHDDY